MRVRVTRVREEMRACAGAQAVGQAIRDAKKADAASPRGERMPKRSKFRRRGACASKKTESPGGGAQRIEEDSVFRRRGGCHAGGPARWSGK